MVTVIEWIQKASQYPPQTIEGKRRALIMLCLRPALTEGDIKPDDDIEEAVQKVSKIFVQLKNLWAALKKEKPQGVV